MNGCSGQIIVLNPIKVTRHLITGSKIWHQHEMSYGNWSSGRDLRLMFQMLSLHQQNYLLSTYRSLVVGSSHGL